MNRVKTHQPQLPFPSEVPWNRFPKAIRKQAQELLTQMLGEAVRAEFTVKEKNGHERKDQIDTS